jgi:LysR family nitrogen assimilation transcriptional regulator
MDLRQLNTFMQVAELGSLSKASDRLRTAQPALSRQIRMLESELCVALFTRHGRGMQLTHAGNMLRIRAAGILRQVEEARTDLTADAGVVRGQVVFGVPPTVGDVLATRLVERFMTLYPQVRLRVVNAFSGYLLEWLYGGEIDVAVVYGAEHDPNIRMAPLLLENLCFVSAPQEGHDAGQAAAVSFAEVVRSRLILPSPQHGLRRLIEQAARDARLTLDVQVEADALQVLKGLVQRRLGATILPHAAVHAEVAAGALMTRLVVDPPLSRRLVVAQPRQASAAVRRFIDVLQTEVAEMVQSGVWEGRLLVSEQIKA